MAPFFHGELGRKGERSGVWGWQMKGEATLVKSGGYWEQTKERAVRRFAGKAAKTEKAALVIRLKESYNIVSGPDAGRRPA